MCKIPTVQIKKEEDILAMLLLAKNLARRAGNLIVSMHSSATRTRLSLFTKANGHGTFNIDQKSSTVDLVTSADRASQKLIFEELRTRVPHHRLIGEEDGYGDSESLDNRPTWIVDAIDGTTNYVHNLHEFCVSVAFALKGTIAVGVVYAPTTGEMFYAARGYGSFRNDERLCISPCASLRDALVVSEWSYERGASGIRRVLALNERLLDSRVRAVRQLGSGALDLCYVAAGRVDAVYGGVADADRWRIWDYAAGALIAEEAGAVLRQPDGGLFVMGEGAILCATPLIADELVHVLDVNN